MYSIGVGGPDRKIFGSRSMCTDRDPFPVWSDLTQSISILSYDP